MHRVQQALHPPVSSRELYKRTLNTQIRCVLPIFCMPQRLALGEPYGLHFFEQRYRLLIQSVMASYPASARQGAEIPIAAEYCSGNHEEEEENSNNNNNDDDSGDVNDGANDEQPPRRNPPMFLHAHASNRISPGSLACLVQVMRCRIYEDGRADVFLFPLQWVLIEKLWEIPNTGRLFAAQCLKVYS